MRFSFRKASECAAHFYECSRALLMPEEATEWVEPADEAEDALGLQMQERDSPGDDLTLMRQPEIRRTLCNLRRFSMNKSCDKPTMIIQ